MPLIKVPASGKARTSQPYAVALTRSAPQGAKVVDVEGDPPPVGGDDDAEAHHHLAGGDHHHDQGEHLPVLVAQRAREREQRQVARVQHQLQAEQDHQRTAAQQHAGDADREEQSREDEVPGDVHQRVAPRWRPARTTAPTAANSSRRDAASKAIRNRSSRSLPIAEGEPKPSSTVGPSDSIEARLEPMIAIESSTNSARPSSGAMKRWPGIGSQSGSSTLPT